MRVVIAGCGRVGTTLANAMADEGHDVVVVDRDSDKLANLGDAFNGATVSGNEIDQDVLRRAGIEEASAFAAVTASDATNIMALQVARDILGVPRTVARVNDPKNQALLEQLGVPGVSPTDLGASSIRSMLLADGLQVQYAVGAGEVVIADAVVNAAIEGYAVRDLEIPGKMRVCVLVRKGIAHVAEPDMRMYAADRLVISVRVDAIDTVRRLLEGAS